MGFAAASTKMDYGFCRCEYTKMRQSRNDNVYGTGDKKNKGRSQ